MEISEIIDKFELTKEEIDHLRETNKEYSEHGNYTRSNLLGTNKTGEASTFTDTYNPYIEDIYRLNEFAVGYKRWYLNGLLHRENGPAIEYANGGKWWYLNGKYHRVDGPAVEFANGNKWWFLDGIRYSESDYWTELKK